ncbi:MAG: hypothetical protein PHF09_01850, partial [Candidatus Nanoarchaeia archaeon]|nr:hypothetical protein [Candidatus Nanoarchaeia archaeon]
TRAAIKNYNSLADDSISKNIGYVVILLKKQPNESKMEDWVNGVLTANIKYDYQKTYGVGQSDFYLDMNDNSNWDNVFNRYNFWSGRGYLRLKSVGSDSANIEILENKDKVYTNVILDEGNTSNIIYFPGDYCKAGFKLKLNEITSAKDEVLLNINGESFWVREGSRIANNNCIVKEINLKDETKKDVKINCPGNSFTLSIEISPKEEEISNLDEEENVKADNCCPSGKSCSGTCTYENWYKGYLCSGSCVSNDEVDYEYPDYTTSSKPSYDVNNVEEEIDPYLKKAQENLEILLNSYPNEKHNANSFFGEIALLKQIE